MSKKDYVEQVWQLRVDIQNDLRELLKANDGEILVPFYYDEDEVTDDIETLIEDGYDIREGSSYDNMFVTTLNSNGYRKDVYVVSFRINERTNRIEFISSECYIYDITDIEDVRVLATIYEKLFKDFGNK